MRPLKSNVRWEFDGQFWRFEPNPPDCHAVVFEVRGDYYASVNDWMLCVHPSEIEECIPHARKFDTLQNAQEYCEAKIREGVIRSALALGIEFRSDAGTSTSLTYWLEALEPTV